MKISSICIASCLATFAAANSADHEWDTVDSMGSSLERGSLRARGSAEAVVVTKVGGEPATFLADAAAANEGFDPSAGEGGEPGWYLNNELDGCSETCWRKKLECTDHSQLCQTQIDSFEKMQYAVEKAGGGLCANEGDPSWDAGAPFVVNSEFGSSGDKTCHPFKMTTHRISSCNTLTDSRVPLCWCEPENDNIPQCDLPGPNEGEVTANSCAGCRNCVSSGACDDSDGAALYPRSCIETLSCSKSNGITVLQDSCVAAWACNDAPGAYIDSGSCNDMYACQSATKAIINQNSCNAEYACQGAAKAAIGKYSCNDSHACSEAVKIINEDEAVGITIGDFSCSAEFACKGRTGGVGNGSCQGVNACSGGNATIGNEACNGANSCVGFRSACGAIPDRCASACDFLAGNCNDLSQDHVFDSQPCSKYREQYQGIYC